MRAGRAVCSASGRMGGRVEKGVELLSAALGIGNALETFEVSARSPMLLATGTRFDLGDQRPAVLSFAP